MHSLGIRSLALLTSTLLAVALLTLAPVAAPGTFGGSAAHAAPAGKYANAAHRATNKQRAKHEVRKVKKNRCLRKMAKRQARAMARQQRIYHQDLGPVLSRCRLSTVGENVAMGYRSGRAVVNQGWMNSAGHRENILRPQFRLMGIGAKKGKDGRWYVAQVFGRR